MARAKQYADRVNIIKRIKLGSKWPFAPVVEHDGRIVRDHVWVVGREEHHPEGRYYLEWYEGGNAGESRSPSSRISCRLPARNPSNSMPSRPASCSRPARLLFGNPHASR